MNDESTGRIEGDLMSRRQAIALAAGSTGMLLGAGAAEAEEKAPKAGPTRRFDVVVIGEARPG